jgi:hypothetical protein
MMNRLVRTIVFNWLPESVKLKGGMKGMDYRAQATFLPQVLARGTQGVLPQMFSLRYLDEQAKLRPEGEEEGEASVAV